MITKFDLYEKKKIKKLKEYKLIYPPKTKKECVDIMIKNAKYQFKLDPNLKIEGTGSNKGEFYKDDLENGKLEKFFYTFPLRKLQHESIHAIQTIRYKDMWSGDMSFFKNIMTDEKSYKKYLSMPSEIMAYAFSASVKYKGSNLKKGGIYSKSIYNKYEEIGGEVFKLFKKYYKGYLKWLKKQKEKK